METTYSSCAEIGDDKHVLIHVLPDGRKGDPPSWHSYIHDLDYFFTKLYKYHQRSGFFCLVIDQILELFQFVFVTFFTLFLLHLVDYEVLFRNKLPLRHNTTSTGNDNLNNLPVKVTLSDCLLPIYSLELTSFEKIVLLFASLFWILRFIKFIQSCFVYSAVRRFYLDVLRVTDCSEFTWTNVQTRLVASQRSCFFQVNPLTELDIHNRILRRENYMLALSNKDLLPIHYDVPLIGQVTYLSRGLRYNIELLLFKGPFALFENNCKLRETVKSTSTRDEIAKSLEKHCLVLAAVNFILFPIIFFWQILHTFYSYTETLKRDPSHVFGSRCWSSYARFYCRHFNELDHQLDQRFNKAYKPATMFMDSFTSPLFAVLMKHIGFLASAVFSVIALLTIYDEDVITVEHMLTIMTVLGICLAGSRGFLHAERNPVKYTRSELGNQVLNHIHYCPYGQYSICTKEAYNFVSNLFPYKIVAILEDLLSPLITPYILAKHMRLKSYDVVDFFRNYSINVEGLGDICLFAMLDVKSNGNPKWTLENQADVIQKTVINEHIQDSDETKSEMISKHGKLELSLINFKLSNPNWEPNSNQEKFVNCVLTQSLSQAKKFASATNESVNIAKSLRKSDNFRTCSYDSVARSYLDSLNYANLSSVPEDSSISMSLSAIYLHETRESMKNYATETQPLVEPSTSQTK